MSKKEVPRTDSQGVFFRFCKIRFVKFIIVYLVPASSQNINDERPLFPSKLHQEVEISPQQMSSLEEAWRTWLGHVCLIWVRPGSKLTLLFSCVCVCAHAHLFLIPRLVSSMDGGSEMLSWQ